jgi:hypothetical protein
MSNERLLRATGGADHIESGAYIEKVKVAPGISRAESMTSGCVVLDIRLRIERRLPAKRVKTW